MSRSLRGHGERGKLKGSRARFIPTAGGQSRSPLQIPNLFRHSLKLTGDFCRCLLQSDSPPVGTSGLAHFLSMSVRAEWTKYVCLASRTHYLRYLYRLLQCSMLTGGSVLTTAARRSSGTQGKTI